MKRKKIGTIAQELARCRAAFKRHPRARFFWCCHHEILIENADRIEGWKNRIGYILRHKPHGEQAMRFRNFRPVKNRKLNQLWEKYLKSCKSANFYYKATEIQDTLTKADADFSKEWPNNTWNNYSIFPWTR